jgi:acyl-CoA thioester hydrolase
MFGKHMQESHAVQHAASQSVYEFEHVVSHAEVDFLGEQKLSALLAVFERAAVEASARAGYSAREYSEAGKMWIIRRTSVCRFLPIGGTDRLRVRTRVGDFRRARSLREYQVLTGQRLVAEAATDWVYCDIASGRPSRIPPELAAALSGGSMLPSAERAPSPLPAGAGEPVRWQEVVRPSHLDHLGHVNNAAYADLLEDAAFAWFEAQGWNLERMLAHEGALRPVSLDIEYLSDASRGESLEILTWGDPPNVRDALPHALSFVQTIRTLQGRIVARSQSGWFWRRRPSILGAPPPSA